MWTLLSDHFRSLFGLLLLASGVLVLTWAASPATAAEHELDVREAQRRVVAARLQLRHYIRTEFPLRYKQLNAEIKLAEAEIDLLERRVDSFRYVSHRDRNDYSSPTTVNIKQMENALYAAQLDLELVKAERTELIMNDRARRRLLRMELQAAQQQLDLLRPKAAEPKAIRNYRNAA